MAQAIGATPLYLHYNSGRHVSQNGRAFAALLQQLVERWPVPVDELLIVGHSMGGLVARSACHHGATAGQGWRKHLKKLVCLGTPHHGAPLERGGRWIDMLLGLSPYVAPFARLGKARSAGITDLRFGNLQDADWDRRDRHAQQRDDRLLTTLPAALTPTCWPQRWPNGRDGFTTPSSATAWCHWPARWANTVTPRWRCRCRRRISHVVTRCGHLDLLCHAQVHAQLLDWLTAPVTRRR